MRIVLLLVIILVGCTAEAPESSQDTRSPADLVITGAQIVDVDTGELLTGKAIVIRRNRIEALVNAADAPETVLKFDARDRFVIPGLWDMHAHALYERWPINSEEGAPYTWGPYMDLMLANGVTGFRDMWGSPAAIDQASKDIESGERFGPRFVAAGMAMGWFEYMSGLEKAETEDEARALVRKAHENGADFIKFGLWNPAFLLAPTIDAARQLGLDVVGHVPPDMAAIEAAEAGLRSIEHSFGAIQGCTPEGESLFDVARTEFAESSNFPFPLILHSDPLFAEFDEAKCAQQAKRLAELDVWLSPTVGLWEAKANAQRIDITTDARFELVNAADRKIWIGSQIYWRRQIEENGDLVQRLYNVRLKIVKTMHDNGVAILAGSDFMNMAATPGMGLHDELRNYQIAGLSPIDALRTATVEPARYLRRTDDFGAVAAGRIADLVILAENPLENIKNVSTVYAVVTNGVLLDRNALDQLVESAKNELGN